MATEKHKNDDDDLFWDDNVPATHNNLVMMTAAKEKKKTVQEQQNDYNCHKDVILQHFIRLCGHEYLVIDIHKLISKYAGFQFAWKWCIRYVTGTASNSLALYDGCRKVVCCSGPDWTTVHGRDTIFGSDSKSMEENVKFKIHTCNYHMKLGVCSNGKNYFWFKGKPFSTKIDTKTMSRQKQEMFGSIFGHLPSQQKGVTVIRAIKTGDIVEMRLVRKRQAKRCSMEIRHNDGNWKMICERISVPVVLAADLWFIGDSVSFIQ
eukprot:147724_1